MDETTKIPPPVPSPTSLGELTTHFGYLRRDVDQNKIDQKKGFEDTQKSFESIIKRLDNLTDGYITKSEFAEVGQKPIADHEIRIRSLEKTVTKIVTWGAAGVIFISIVEFVITKFLK